METDIEPYAELFIAYGSDYWRKHLDKAPIDKIIAAYPDIQQSDEYLLFIQPVATHTETLVDREGEHATDINPSIMKAKKNKNKEKFSKKAINRVSRVFKNEFLISNKDNNEKTLKEKFACSKRGGSRRRIHEISYTDKVKKDRKNKKKTRQQEATKKRKTRGYDNPSLSQAKKREDWPMWEEAIDKEYQQMIDEGVFEENKEKFKKGANIIGSMIVLTIKRNQDGSIDKYKARLVCLGNQQDESSYDCIKSGTARAATVKMLISLQAKTGVASMVLDVKGAYLKSHVREDIDEKLYVRLPDNRIMKLKKYLYGLKQAGFEWEKNVTACLIAAGYQQSEADPRTFSRWQGKRYIIMCIHVDDFFCSRL